MKELIRKFEKESGLEIYGLGARREKWEHCMEKFAELVVGECATAAREWTDVYVVEDTAPKQIDVMMRQHFGVEE